MISREESLQLLKRYLKDEKIVKHSLAVESILKKTAEKLNGDKEIWRLTGLLHDLDYEYTREEPEKHSIVSSQLLEGLLPQEAINAIKAHNYQHTLQTPETLLDKLLIAADAVSGLIIASALVMPSKKLSEVTIKTLSKKFKDNSFAVGCNRKKIKLCEEAGVELNEFLELSLSALQDIADSLGL
jgi:putative nucleotidyltransferase with HDIG domain